MLDQLQLPTEALLHFNSNCKVHNAALETYYCNIVNCLESAASHCVPKVKVGIEKYCKVHNAALETYYCNIVNV